jgi:hypothetical protein
LKRILTQPTGLSIGAIASRAICDSQSVRDVFGFEAGQIGHIEARKKHFWARQTFSGGNCCKFCNSSKGGRPQDGA